MLHSLVSSVLKWLKIWHIQLIIWKSVKDTYPTIYKDPLSVKTDVGTISVDNSV